MPESINYMLEPRDKKQRGATSVEYAVIIVLVVLAMTATIIYMVDPSDPFNSLLPGAYNTVGDKIGNFGTVTLPAN